MWVSLRDKALNEPRLQSVSQQRRQKLQNQVLLEHLCSVVDKLAAKIDREMNFVCYLHQLCSLNMPKELDKMLVECPNNLDILPPILFSQTIDFNDRSFTFGQTLETGQIEEIPAQEDKKEDDEPVA